MTSETKKPSLYIVVNNHFDLTWRRCWQRPFTFQGQTFISYTDLEAYYLLDNIELAQRYPEYKFEAESTQVVRKFIERFPEQLQILKQLAREGRFGVTGGGEAIVDANMISGESLVRNYVDGLLWVEDTLGLKTRLAVRNDAFGNSAQLPQILRGCEISWATGMSYSPADELYWRGLDGSTILHKTLPIVAMGGGNNKYSPCPTCAGTGYIETGDCPACQGRGIDPLLRSHLPEEIDEESLAQFGAGLVWITPEELLPNAGLVEWAEKMREKYDVRFALEEDVLPHLQPWLATVDAAPADCLHPGIELNPNNSGCLVTRIETKQTVRRQETQMLAVEALCAMAALKGIPYPKTALNCIRQNQYFTMFHDSITATHIDAAYVELKDIYAQIDQDQASAMAAILPHFVQLRQADYFSVINLVGQKLTQICTAVLSSSDPNLVVEDDAGQPVNILTMRIIDPGSIEISFLVRELAPFSARVYHVSKGNAPLNRVETFTDPVIENNRFRIQADEHGLVSIFDKTLGHEIATRGEYRPGELILEHDEGSPWATLCSDQRRAPLAAFTRFIGTEMSAGCQRLLFDVDAPREFGFSGRCLRARISVTLIEGLDRVDFKMEADWAAYNHRLRIALPVPVVGPSKHMYEIPYGMIERKPYEPWFRWAGANGDWPAINWAGVEQPGLSVALLNKGTPSYRIEHGAENTEVILLSVLRSPAIPTYLHEPEFYSMTDFDGMRDEGKHTFEYSLTAYNGAFNESSVVLDAESYNTAPVVVAGVADLPAMPVFVRGSARISAVKWAEQGSGLVLRVVEFRGKGGESAIRLPDGVRTAEKTNLLERQAQTLPILDGVIHFDLRPWEIATIKLN